MSTTSRSFGWLILILPMSFPGGATAEEIAKIQDSFGVIGNLSTQLKKDNELIEPSDQAWKGITQIISTPSFPLRIANDDADDDTWNTLPEAATKPKRLIRSYAINNCRFSLATETYSIDLESKSPDLISTQQSIPSNTIQRLNPETSASLSISAELTARVRPETKALCREFFSDKKILFGSITLAKDSLFLANRSGERISLTEEQSPEAKKIYLSWDENHDQLIATDSIGLTVDIKSSTVFLPEKIEGNYYLNYEPSWNIRRMTRQLASH